MSVIDTRTSIPLTRTPPRSPYRQARHPRHPIGHPSPALAPLGRSFWRLFAADTVSSLGTVISTLAIQFLLIDTLNADEQAIGIVRAAQWAPYLVLGLLAGVVA